MFFHSAQPFECCCSGSLRCVKILDGPWTPPRCVREAPVFGQMWPWLTLSCKLGQVLGNRQNHFYCSWVTQTGREGGRGHFWPAPDEWETSQRGPDPHQGGSLNAQHPLEQGVLTCVVDHLSLGKVEPCQVLDLCVHRQPCCHWLD